MKGVPHLALRYLAHNRLKTTVLVLSLTLIFFLPWGLQVLVEQGSADLLARAESTPLLVGSRGSPLELVLSSIYFDVDPPAPLTWGDREKVLESGLATAIPLRLGFRASGYPIVGTGLKYFDFRRLELASGHFPTILGECALGSSVAAELDLGPGDTVVSSPETVFDLAGVYPLRMKVTGVLAPAFTADDRAVFVDVKTAWVIEGLGHGHQDLSAPEASAAVLDRDDDNITANAAVVEYNEITEETLSSFHFHGDLMEYPLSAMLVVPRDERSEVILRGRWEDPATTTQIVRPRVVMEDLLSTILTLRTFILAGSALMAIGTISTTALVFWLSLRLRRREILTLHKIGGSRRAIAGLLASEAVLVLAVSAGLATLLVALVSRYAADIAKALVLA